MKMISNIEPLKAAIVSILSAIVGTINKLMLNLGITLRLITVDIVLQRLACTVAILAGIVAIVNGIKGWFKKVKEIKDEIN